MWFNNLRLWFCNNWILFCRLCWLSCGRALTWSLNSFVTTAGWEVSDCCRTGTLGCWELGDVPYAVARGTGSELDFVFGSTSLSWWLHDYMCSVATKDHVTHLWLFFSTSYDTANFLPISPGLFYDNNKTQCTIYDIVQKQMFIKVQIVFLQIRASSK